jgi:16S rRNA processing protein RimM
MPSSDETPVTVGRIVAAHGVRGEIKVEPLTDFPQRFAKNATLYIDDAPVRITASRVQGRIFTLKLEGVDTRTAAEALRGKELTVPQTEALNAGRFYQHDIIGLDVVDAHGEALGRVADVLATGANDVYIVRGDRGELLLPAVDEVIKRIDLTERRVVVELLPGLDFKSVTRKAKKRSKQT